MDGLKWPRVPNGYQITLLSCVPCGERVRYDPCDIDEMRDFLIEHDEHIRAYLEDFCASRMPRR